MSKPTIRNYAYLQNLRVEGLQGFKLTEALDDVASATGNVAEQLASSPDGHPIIPAKIGQLQAQHLGSGLLNFAIVDNSENLQRAVDYHVEIANNANFSGAEHIHGLPRRNGEVHVPNGHWYVKAYSQYRFGGPPSEPVTIGPIKVTGSPYSARLATQGCGTGNPGDTGTGAGLKITR